MRTLVRDTEDSDTAAGVSSTVDGRDFVASFARGLTVITTFDSKNPRMTLSEVAQKAGITRAAARRFLFTLRSLGYVSQEGKFFALTPKTLDLGFAYLTSTPMWDKLYPVLEEISDKTHESCSASVLDGTDIIYIGRVPTKRIMSVTLSVGTRLPSYVTSMGRVMLAHLPREQIVDILKRSNLRKFTQRTVTDQAALLREIEKARAQGYAIIDQELEMGLISIAVPVRTRSSKIACAINVGARSDANSSSKLIKHVLPLLKASAERLERILI